MAKLDPYRLTSPDAPATARAPVGVSRADVLRSTLWSVVVISAFANMITSYAGAATSVHLVCGAVTALGGGALIVRKLRSREHGPGQDQDRDGGRR